MDVNTSESSPARIEVNHRQGQSHTNQGRSIKPEGSIEDLLCRNIDDVDSSSKLISSGIIQYEPLVPIVINNVGALKFRSTTSEIASFIRVAQQARVTSMSGDQFEQDRTSFEFEADDIHFNDPSWDKALQRICKTVRGDIGVDHKVKRVHARLSKLSIFGMQSAPSSIVIGASDPGVFGTLAIDLPTECVGGDVWLMADRMRLDCVNKASKVTYRTCYSRVDHCISPIEEGYKCVITYDLIKNPDTPTRSISEFCQRVRTTSDLLSSWCKESETLFITYPLTPGLGQRDNNRQKICHLSQCCKINRTVCLLKASMSKPRKKSKDKLMNLFNFRSLSSSKRLMPFAKYIDFPQETIVAGYDFGAEKVVFDVILLIPRANLAKFFAKINSELVKWQTYLHLGEMLESWHLTNDEFDFGFNIPLRQLVPEVCDAILDAYEGDIVVGFVATTAAQLRLNALFSRAIDHIEVDLPGIDWEVIGSFTNMKCPPVDESLIIQALTKSNEIHRIYNSFIWFNRGLSKIKLTSHELAFKRGWLDTVVLSAMKSASLLSATDIRVLARMLSDFKSNHPAMRTFIWYQNVRKLVTDFGLGICSPVVALEICGQLRHSQNRTCAELRSILKLVTGPALNNFELELVFKFIESSRNFDDDERVAREVGFLTAKFYLYIDDPHHRRELLLHIRRAALHGCRNDFLVHFLGYFSNQSCQVPPCDSTLVRDIFAFAHRGLLSPRKSFGGQDLDPSRPSFTHEGHDQCNCVQTLHAYLLDDDLSDEEEIVCTNPTQRAWSDKSWTGFSARVDRNENGDAILKVRKRFARLPQKHRRASNKLAVLLNGLGDITKTRDKVGDGHYDVCALWLPHNGAAKKITTT